MRKDEAKNYGYDTKDLLKNAPVTQDGQFKVKRVL
jgi:Asp-tRNA(Asn)/Glu-tRNA(Gln) amidotransferase C subunit